MSITIVRIRIRRTGIPRIRTLRIIPRILPRTARRTALTVLITAKTAANIKVSAGKGLCMKGAQPLFQ